MTETLEQAIKDRDDQARQVELIYGNLGRTMSDEKLQRFFHDLSNAYMRAALRVAYPERHPWFPTEATPNYMSWFLHENNRIMDWLRRETVKLDKTRETVSSRKAAV